MDIKIKDIYYNILNGQHKDMEAKLLAAAAE